MALIGNDEACFQPFANAVLLPSLRLHLNSEHASGITKENLNGRSEEM
jgi:hypothetical protein